MMRRLSAGGRSQEEGDVVASLGGIAGLIAAIAWTALVIVGLFVVFALFRVLESTRMLIEGIRQETVPLLSEVTTTVTSVNKELERVDGIMESAGHIVKNVERVSSVVEQTVSSPLIKLAAFGAGASRAVRRLRRKK
jgi:uncharacterized protein YoxC